MRWNTERRYGGRLVDHRTQALNAQLDMLRAYCEADLVRDEITNAFTRLYRAQQGKPVLHFVRFKDDRYLNAVKTFGRPDFVHRHWDHRAAAEVMPGDIVVFAEGDEHQPVTPFAYDDSAFF